MLKLIFQMVLKPICEPACLTPLSTQGSVTAFYFKYQHAIKYSSFLMIKLSLEIVLCIVVSKKARTVHLVCDKAHVESIGSGICGQPQNSS